MFYFGDCLKTLRSMKETVDLTITSPPYNKGEAGNRPYNEWDKVRGEDRMTIKYENNSDDMPQDEYEKQQIELLNIIYDKTSESGNFFYNHKNNYVDNTVINPYRWISKSKWKIRQEIVWNKMSSAYNGVSRFHPRSEKVFWLSKGKVPLLKGKDARLGDVWKILPQTRANHPAPYPIALPARIIFSMEDIYKKPLTILDPYVGSGTTVVAAKYLGHNWIGIDNSRQYLDFAMSRVENMNKQDIHEPYKDRKRKHEIKQEHAKYTLF